MVDDWRAAVEDLKDNVRHEIITLTNLARELTNIAYPIADILEQHIKKVGAQILATCRRFVTDTQPRLHHRENCQPFTCWTQLLRTSALLTHSSSARTCTKPSWKSTPRSTRGLARSWRKCCRPGRSPSQDPSIRLPSSLPTPYAPLRTPCSRPGPLLSRLNRSRHGVRWAAEAEDLLCLVTAPHLLLRMSVSLSTSHRTRAHTVIVPHQVSRNRHTYNTRSVPQLAPLVLGAMSLTTAQSLCPTQQRRSSRLLPRQLLRLLYRPKILTECQLLSLEST